MQGDALVYQVEGVAYDLGRDDGEDIGKGNEEDTQQKPVFVLEKIFVEIT